MAEDDDNLDDFKLPPHSNEDADTQLDAKALKLVEDYVASLNRSKNENTIRQGVRETIVKLGIHSLAFQHELTAQKMMDQADRREYMAGRRRMGRILADKQESLFPEELERIKKRKERAKDRAAKKAQAEGAETPEQQERRLAADFKRRSDPASGGAGKKSKAKKPAATAAERAIETSERNLRLAATTASSPGAAPADAAANAATEQTEGEALLATAGKGEPLSQSAQAAAVREQLGLDKS
jgi:hypothetical protein